MIISRFKFSVDLFSGTLLDGEFIKENNGNWIFFINDIAYYKGDNIITKTFQERFKILNHILRNEYIEDTKLSVCNIAHKRYFELNNIESLCTNYLDNLTYKCCGIYFKI